MKLNNQIVLTELREDYVAVPVGGGKGKYMIRLNATGADIWRGFKAGLRTEEIAHRKSRGSSWRTTTLTSCVRVRTSQSCSKSSGMRIFWRIEP